MSTQERYQQPILKVTEIPFLGQQHEDGSPAADQQDDIFEAPLESAGLGQGEARKSYRI